MPPIRDFFANLFMGDRVKRVEALTNAVIETYERMPYSISPEQVLERLGEVDSQLMDLLVRQIKDRQFPLDLDNDSFRLDTVYECRRLFMHDVVTQYIIGLWTDYGFGLRVDVMPMAEEARDDWDEFWNARRNSPVLGEMDISQLSDNLLSDGEFYFVFFISKLDGTSTVRVIPTDEIRQIVTLPTDKFTDVYYKREYYEPNSPEPKSMYFRDWRVSDEEAKQAVLDGDIPLAEEMNQSTDVTMMHVSFRKHGKHGWPLMTAGAAWSRAYRNFLQDRAAVAKAIASYVDKVKVKGTNRTVDALRARLESSRVNSGFGTETNPSTTAGSDWIENQAMERSRMPMQSGASDAEKDGTPLLAQAGLAGRIFPHYLGRGETFRLATASAMEVPVKKAFSRYQLLWSAIWRDVAEIVLSSLEKYSSVQFSTYEIVVHTDNIVEVDLNEVSDMLSSVSTLYGQGLIDDQEGQMVSRKLLQVGLNALGISEANDLLPDMEEAQMGEAAGIDTYRSSLRAVTYGLWSGALMPTDFIDGMRSAIELNLTGAWQRALEQYGLSLADMTIEEHRTLDEAIMSELSHVEGYMQFVLANSKAGGGKLKSLMPRMQLWVNRWNEVFNKATVMAGKDKPLEWEFGATEEHCTSCAALRGKVKRTSVWEKFFEATGLRPQSQALQCRGFNCQCRLQPTTKPISRGPLPVR